MKVIPRDVGHIRAHIRLVYIFGWAQGLPIGDECLQGGVIFRLKYRCELLLDFILVLLSENVLKLLATLPERRDALDYCDQNEDNAH